MKSIREWREEKEMNEASGGMFPATGPSDSNPFSKNAFRNVMGGGEVDPTIKLKLRSRILDLVKEFPQMGQAQLFQSIMSVVGQLLTHGSGSKVATGNLYSKLNKAVPQGQPNGTQVQTNNSEGMR